MKKNIQPVQKSKKEIRCLYIGYRCICEEAVSESHQRTFFFALGKAKKYRKYMRTIENKI